jgi:hypothetical protein
MMRLSAVLLASLVLISSAHAQEKVVFANDKVSFVLPVGFSRMPQEIVDKKYPRGSTPEYVFSNEKTTVSIAAGYTPNSNLTFEQLPQFKEFMEKTFERNVPGLQWITRGFKEINEIQWIHLEFQSHAIDTEIRNIILMTALDNGLVMFNFNSTVGDYEFYKAALEQSQQTIAVKP